MCGAGNPLTLMYSVFMSIWSVVFLSVWRRKEAEHSFLWGSEGYEDSEPPRPQFKVRLTSTFSLATHFPIQI